MSNIKKTNTVKKPTAKKTSAKATTKKTTSKKAASKKDVSITVTNEQFYGKLRHLRPGKSVTSAKFGTVKCTAAGKDTKTGKKSFSVSQSKVAQNRGGYTFGEVVKAFGLKK